MKTPPASADRKRVDKLTISPSQIVIEVSRPAVTFLTTEIVSKAVSGIHGCELF